MRKRGFSIWFGITVILTLFPFCLVGGVPSRINYQGKLTDASGQPVNLDTAITFAIYTQPSGGSAVWSETQSVTVTDGIFNTLLGRVTSIEPELFSSHSAVYLGVKVGSDSEMTPRQEVVSVAYAMKTEGISVREGNVGIGTDTPETKLEVNGVISGENTRPIQQQLVHQRVLYGYTGDQSLSYGSSWVTVRHCYGPFGYAVPSVQPRAVRKYRLYAVYSDNMTTEGENQVWFETQNVIFILGKTWGGATSENRDSYSDWYTGQPVGNHSNVKIRTTIGGKSGVLHYLVLQTWDFFE